MEFLLIGSVISLFFLYTLVRTNRIGRKTIQFNDDFRPENITDEYARVMTERVNAAKRLREDV